MRFWWIAGSLLIFSVILASTNLYALETRKKCLEVVAIAGGSIKSVLPEFNPFLDGEPFALVRLLISKHKPFSSMTEQRPYFEEMVAIERSLRALLETDGLGTQLGLNIEALNLDLSKPSNRLQFSDLVLAQLNELVQSDLKVETQNRVPASVSAPLARWNELVDIVVKRNIGLIVTPIKHYPRRLWDDFEPAALQALHRAVRYFDLEMDYSFSNLAVTFVKRSLSDEWEILAKPSHMGVETAKRIKILKRLQAEEWAKSGRRLSVEDIMNKMEVSRRLVVDAIEAMRPTTNLTGMHTFDTKERGREGIVPDNRKFDADLDLRLREKKVRLLDSLLNDITNERDRQILRDRYGIQGTLEPVEQMQIREIAKDRKLSSIMISRIANERASELLRAVILIRGDHNLADANREFLKSYYGLFGVVASKASQSNGSAKIAQELIGRVTYEDFEALLEE